VGPAIRPLFFLLLHLFPQRCTAPYHAAPARAMGRPGHRLARTPSQGTAVCSPRGLPRGKRRPLYHSTAAPPRRSPHHTNQPGRTSCPCTCPLDRTLQPSRPSPSRKPSRFGGFPFLCSPPWGKRRRGVEEENRRGEGGGRAPRRRWCPKTGGRSSSWGAVPVSAGEAEAVRVGRGAGTEEGVGRRHVRLHRATVFIRTATTTPPPRSERRCPPFL
jgi:hypothetical protein